MKRLDIYDPAMCCSTGVCGPTVDPVLVRFATDVKWLQKQGAEAQRFNLSQNPAAFVENEKVKQALTEKGDFEIKQNMNAKPTSGTTSSSCGSDCGCH